MRLWWLALVLLCSACRGCGDDAVAELSEVVGKVERDHADKRGAFAQATRGDTFALGDGMRTGADGRARLALLPDGAATVEPNTLLRFLPGQADQKRERIALEEGAVAIESAQLDLEVHTPLAIARLTHPGKLRVSADAAGVRFDVLVGKVAIDHDGEVDELAVGQSFALTPKGLTADDLAPPGPVAVPEEPEGPAVPEAGAAEAVQGPRQGQPRPDMALPSENAVLHVPTPPVHAQVSFPPCDEGAEVEHTAGRRTQRLRSQEPLVLTLDVGSHRVRVRCGDVLERDVTVRVQRDAATQELPRSAPRVDVEADGRKYTVHYQNVLPAVTFVWPKAPPGPYQLVLEGKKSQRLTGQKPQRELRPGELTEGAYRFWFEGASGQKSTPSDLRIVFDNTARSAYLSEPRNGSPALGMAVTVAGGALTQSEVSVGELRLPLDAQGRFRGDVPLSSEANSLAVRVRHPLAGVHYYLRRIR